MILTKNLQAHMNLSKRKTMWHSLLSALSPLITRDIKSALVDDDEFRFNDASTHEGHLRQNGELTWFCSETIIMISHKCIKCKTRTNLKIKAVILC